jgi:hypothetical protein
MRPIWPKEYRSATELQPPTVNSKLVHQQRRLVSTHSAFTLLCWTNEYYSGGHRSALLMQAYCVTACLKMDLPPDALRRDAPMGGLGMRRGHMKWMMVPASPGESTQTHKYLQQTTPTHYAGFTTSLSPYRRRKLRCTQLVDRYCGKWTSSQNTPM